MEYPVDVLTSVDPESLEHSAKDYMSKLLHRNPEKPEYLSIPGSKKIEIGLCNVGFVPLHGANIIYKVLALFLPEENSKAVGLYLLNHWWSAEDILKTADPTRTGLLKVKTTGERIVLYVLNRIIHRTKERADCDVKFLCHEKDEFAKILWKNGEAVGFYSVKPEGTICSHYLTKCYDLPIMDTIFVRKCHRSNGYGLQMLEDFVWSFKNDCIGLQRPLSPAMYKVCEKYLNLHPQDTKLLWETNGTGCSFQRSQIARKLQAMDLNKSHEFIGDEEDDNFQMEVGITQVEGTMHYTEDVEEVVQVKKRKVVHDTAVTTYCRSCILKHKKPGTDTEVTIEKTNRVEDIEPDVHCAEDDLVHEDGERFLRKDTVETVLHDVTTISEISRLHCEEQNILPCEPSSHSETKTEQMIKIPPFMEIRNNKDAQMVETVQSQQDQTPPAEYSNKNDTEEAGKISVVENIVDETVEIEVEKREAGALVVSLVEKAKNTVEESGIVQECSWKKIQETEDLEPSPDNKEEKVSTLMQQEENKTTAYRLGSKGKHDKRRSNYETSLRSSRRLDDQAAKSELVESISRSTSKKALAATSKHVYTRKTQSIKQPEESKQVQGKPKYQGLKQTESPEKERVMEKAENENVEGKIETINITTEVYSENSIVTLRKKEMNNENSSLDQQPTDDQDLMEVEKDRADKNKMDEKLRNKEQEKETASAEEVTKTSMDGEEIGLVDVNFEISKLIIDVKAHEPSASEHIEEQGEEPAVETVPVTDGHSKVAALKCHKSVELLVADNENALVAEDKTENLNIDESDVRHDKIMENIISKYDDIVLEPNLTDASKMAESQEVEPLKESEIVEAAEEQVLTFVTDETKIETFQKEKALKETLLNSVQDTHNEEKRKHITESGEDDERVKLDVQSELSEAAEDKTSFETPFKNPRRLKHQGEKSEVTTRVLRSATKAAKDTSKTKAEKQQVKTKQTVDDLEVEQMMDVLVSHTETALEQSISFNAEMEHVKAIEMEVGPKTPEQSAAENVEEQEEEMALEKGPSEDTEEAILTCATDVHLDFDDGLTTTVAGEDATEISQPQVEPHRPECIDTESLAKHTEKETDKRVKSKKSVALNDEVKVPESTITDEAVRKEADTAQETPTKEPQCQHVNEDEDEASSVSPLRFSKRLQGQAAESEIKMRILENSSSLTGKGTPQRRHKKQMKTLMLQEEPERLDEAKNNEMNIISGIKAVEEHMESVTVNLFELSETVKEVENRVQKDKTSTELVHGEHSEDVMETTSLLTFQEASVVLVDVKKVLPNLTGDCSPAQEEIGNKLKMSEQAADMPEKVREELRAKVVEEEIIEKEFVNPIIEEPADIPSTLQDLQDFHNTQVVKDLIYVEEYEEELATNLAPERQTGRNESGNETTQSQEVVLLTKTHYADDENALVQMDVTESVTEKIDKENEEAVELGMNNTLITSNKQERDNCSKEGMKDVLEEKTTLAELDTSKTLSDCKASTTPAQGHSVEGCTKDILVSTSRNPRRRTLPAKLTPERKTRPLHKETRVNKNTEEEISDEDFETVFTRNLRRRTITVTASQRRRSKHITGLRVAESEMGGHEIVTVQGTEVARPTSEETQETYLKYIEVPVISKTARKDQPQEKTLLKKYADKVDKVTDVRKAMNKAAVDHAEVETTERGVLLVDAPDKNREKAPDKPNQEQVKSTNSELEREQHDEALQEMLLEKTFEKGLGKGVEEKHFEEKKGSSINLQITEAVPDQLEEGIGYERRMIKKRTITTKALSVRKYKRLCEQDQGGNDGQTIVWANTGDSAPVETMVMEMASVKSPAENQATNHGQEKEDINIMGGEDSKLVAQEEDHGEDHGEANREQQSLTEQTACENNASKAAKVAYEHKRIVATQEVPELYEKIAEKMTEASVIADENFTLALDEELNPNDAECSQVVEETRASFQESEKEITDAEQDSGVMTQHNLQGRESAKASAKQKTTRKRRKLLQDSPSEMENKSEAEEVEEVLGEEVKTPQQKRKSEVKLTPRRSERLFRTKIM
ncbi:uncharacterized protein fam169aa [Silurus meridionalis]|nr:uncharacterized protein fam169aa [Silurus meridionalis]